MASKKRRALAAGAVGSIVGTTVGLVPLAAHADTPTMSYGNLRDDWDSNEAGLTPGDVASSDFGNVFTTQLTHADGTNDNGQIYAEPTVVNGTLIVANENNNVYGLDPATGAVKWRRNVGTPWQSSTIGCGDLSPNVGITSTPVYNAAANAIYFTDKQSDPDAAHPNWYMHAIDPATGAEKTGFPVRIQGTASNDSSAVFNPEYEMQRPGLLLLNGVVYAAFGGHCDMSPETGPGYRGYVVGVDTQTAAIDSMWTSESVAAGAGAGIWQSGGALRSDGAGLRSAAAPTRGRIAACRSAAAVTAKG
jgi:outer membrane protein assembly factor BamB